MAQEIYTREADSSSMTTIIVSILVVLIVALALYFAFVRDARPVGGPDEGSTEVQFNNTIDGGTAIPEDTSGVLDY